ncbi:hypothetical protein B0H19DRAFT_1074375 [Mycena capillaripes]|nr:hypothetical protein B0H19DRAFT_1074375 [Mycena capillaripes]
MSDTTTPPTIPADTTNFPTIALVTTAINNMSIDNTDTDSTGSVPDLEPVTDGESDTQVNVNGETNHPLPVVPMDPRTVNGMVHTDQLMVNNLNGSPAFGQYPNNGNYRAITPAYRAHVGVQTMGPSSNPNWRAGAYLANRAFRDAGLVQGGPVGNHFRRGGSPYHVHAARPLNIEMVNDLILHLQRLERSLQGFLDHTERQWLPGQF